MRDIKAAYIVSGGTTEVVQMIWSTTLAIELTWDRSYTTNWSLNANVYLFAADFIANLLTSDGDIQMLF